MEYFYLKFTSTHWYNHQHLPRSEDTNVNLDPRRLAWTTKPLLFFLPSSTKQLLIRSKMASFFECARQKPQSRLAVVHRLECERAHVVLCSTPVPTLKEHPPRHPHTPHH